MTPKKFFVGRAIVFTILLLILAAVAGFKAFNSYIYNQKQAPADQQVNNTNPDVDGNQVPATSQKPVAEPNFEGEADPSRMTLTMNKWRWIRSEYNDSSIKTPKKDVFTLTFNANKTFSATTDCNSISGKYSADTKNKTITFTEMMSTEMACGDSQEEEFRNILANSSQYLFTSRGELILGLKYDSGSVIFR